MLENPLLFRPWLKGAVMSPRAENNLTQKKRRRSKRYFHAAEPFKTANVLPRVMEVNFFGSCHGAVAAKVSCKNEGGCHKQMTKFPLKAVSFNADDLEFFFSKKSETLIATCQLRIYGANFRGSQIGRADSETWRTRSSTRFSKIGFVDRKYVDFLAEDAQAHHRMTFVLISICSGLTRTGR